MTSEANVIIRCDGRVGRILLNRPRVLNALDLTMIRICYSTLCQWQDDPSIHAVVIEGAGERAFCAGGDIIDLREAQISGNRSVADAFFREEYALNLLIATYPKPYIALVDGICMGGGIGMSVHGAYRVATEHASFGMPETAIGFFPDIGATFLLPRLRGHLGTYLGLTGLRVNGADAVHVGLATHFVPRAKLHAMSVALAKDGLSALAEYAEILPSFSLDAHIDSINYCFAADTVTEIVARLKQEDADWAKAALRALLTVSPSALFWTLKALRNGEKMTLPNALEAEFHLTRTTMDHPDFAEGVRAMVVDKDRRPTWTPGRIEDVNPIAISELFVS